MSETLIDAEQLAQRFHEAYERLALARGYETREASAKPWAEVPAVNRALMIAVCAEVMLPPLDKLRSVHATQGADGNWNYSGYMRGMFNGLELALSIFEGEREPQYRDAPVTYLETLPAPAGPPVAVQG